MVKVSVFSLVLSLLLVNIVLTHLFNWWIRSAEDENEGGISVILYILSIAVTIGVLYSITS